MTREAIFEVWAPSGSPWSNWVKPALFAHLPRNQAADVVQSLPDVARAPAATAKIALIVDLPGATCVQYGLALAAQGYRPVPLFNGLPAPRPEDAAVVRVEPILAALERGTELLQGLNLGTDAPPAFLVDADRQATQQRPSPGAFDNRSIVFATDFPSSARLREAGVGRACLVRQRLAGLTGDLIEAIRGWQVDGIAFEAKWLDEPGPPLPLTLRRPSWWRRLWDGFRYLWFHRNAAGEFGEFIPRSSGG